MSYFSSLLVYLSLQRCIATAYALTSPQPGLLLWLHRGNQLLAKVTWQHLPQISILGALCLYFTGCPVQTSEPLKFMYMEVWRSYCSTEQPSTNGHQSRWINLSSSVFGVGNSEKQITWLFSGTSRIDWGTVPTEKTVPW